MKSIDEYKKQWKEIGKAEYEKGIEEFAFKINIDYLIQEAIKKGQTRVRIEINFLDTILFQKVCEKYKLNYTEISASLKVGKNKYSISGWAE